MKTREQNRLELRSAFRFAEVRGNGSESSNLNLIRQITVFFAIARKKLLAKKSSYIAKLIAMLIRDQSIFETIPCSMIPRI